jgi:hypothetical protein
MVRDSLFLGITRFELRPKIPLLRTTPSTTTPNNTTHFAAVLMKDKPRLTIAGNWTLTEYMRLTKSGGGF